MISIKNVTDHLSFGYRFLFCFFFLRWISNKSWMKMLIVGWQNRYFVIILLSISIQMASFYNECVIIVSQRVLMNGWIGLPWTYLSLTPGSKWMRVWNWRSLCQSEVGEAAQASEHRSERALERARAKRSVYASIKLSFITHCLKYGVNCPHFFEFYFVGAVTV